MAELNRDSIARYAFENIDEFAGIIAEVLPHFIKIGFDPDDQSGKFFELWQKAGLTILPNHYYSVIPNISGIDVDKLHEEWSMDAIEVNIEEQSMLLNCLSKYKIEYSELPKRDNTEPAGRYRQGGAYPPLDAMLTYSMVRHHKPRRIIEIGSGMSTLVMLEALVQNQHEGTEYEMISIDPYVDPITHYGATGNIVHINKSLSTVDHSLFNSLESGDFLFIDSTHALTSDPNNDVFIEYFKVIPFLPSGVLIHIHDIFLPFGYPSDWTLKRRIFWNEQHILHAFLSYNREFKVTLGAQMLKRFCGEHLSRFLPSDYKERDGGSFWISRT